MPSPRTDETAGSVSKLPHAATSQALREASHARSPEIRVPGNQVLTALFVPHRHASDNHRGQLRARFAKQLIPPLAPPHRQGEVQHRNRALPALYVNTYTKFVNIHQYKGASESLHAGRRDASRPLHRIGENEMTTNRPNSFGLHVVLLVAVFVGGASVAADEYQWLKRHRGKAGIDGGYAKQFRPWS